MAWPKSSASRKVPTGGGAEPSGRGRTICSNPYFAYDPSQCMVCYRCVRACEETQGTFALTVEGRGFESRIVASEHETFLDSECVSCGACVRPARPAA